MFPVKKHQRLSKATADASLILNCSHRNILQKDKLLIDYCFHYNNNMIIFDIQDGNLILSTKIDG